MKKSANVMYSLIAVFVVSFGPKVLAEPKELTFEVEPEVIKAKAREGQFLPIPVLKKPLDYQTFWRMYDEHLKKQKAGIHIAVIVDAKNENWPDKNITMHIKQVHNFAKKAMTGSNNPQQPGYAELYGARINKIIPVIYDPKYQKPASIKIADGQYKNINVPVSVNDIILLINDHNPAEKNNGAFINTVEELQNHLDTYLKEGRHMMSKAQYLEQLLVQIKQLDSELEDLYDHRKELKELQEQLPYINEH